MQRVVQECTNTTATYALWMNRQLRTKTCLRLSDGRCLVDRGDASCERLSAGHPHLTTPTAQRAVDFAYHMQYQNTRLGGPDTIIVLVFRSSSFANIVVLSKDNHCVKE